MKELLCLELTDVRQLNNSFMILHDFLSYFSIDTQLTTFKDVFKETPIVNGYLLTIDLTGLSPNQRLVIINIFQFLKENYNATLYHDNNYVCNYEIKWERYTNSLIIRWYNKIVNEYELNRMKDYFYRVIVPKFS